MLLIKSLSRRSYNSELNKFHEKSRLTNILSYTNICAGTVKTTIKIFLFFSSV